MTREYNRDELGRFASDTQLGLPGFQGGSQTPGSILDDVEDGKHYGSVGQMVDELGLPDASARAKEHSRSLNHYQEWATDSLTESEVDSLLGYTGWKYTDINGALKGHSSVGYGLMEGETLKISKETEGDIANISHALSKAPKPPPPSVVYRGMGKGTSALMNATDPGTEMRFNGFQSTSIRPETARLFTSGNFAIIRPKRGAYLEAGGLAKGESEFLMNHATKFRVLGKKRISVASNKLMVVELEEIE